MRYASLFLATILTGLSAITFAQDSNHEVTPEQYVTEEELAAIYVLSEICPSLVDNQAAFEQGYQSFVEVYLPDIQNPIDALKRFSHEANSAPLLLEAKRDADQAGTVKNSQICQELVTYQK